MNAIQNILAGVQQQAQEREKTLADAQREMKQEHAQTLGQVESGATVEAGAVETEAIETMTNEQATDAIHKLSAIVLQLTERLDQKGESL